MEKVKLDKDIILGGVVLDEEKYQVVHLNLKKGNQTDDYSIEKEILLINISGKISVATEESVEIVDEFEILKVPKDKMHTITCIEDSQLIAIKI